MEEIINAFNEIIGLPEFIVNHLTFIPEFIRMALLKSIYFVPILFVLYLLIELFEKYFLKNIQNFIKLMRRFSGIVTATLGIVPECGYSVISSILYSRNVISRGALFAGLIMCSDEALPLLFLDLEKAITILPLLAIKFVVAIVVAYGIDIVETILNLRIKRKDGVNFLNTDIHEFGCCHHTIMTNEESPNIYRHPVSHTINIFMFMFLSLVVFYGLISLAGSAENLASMLLIDSPIPIVVVAAIGLISNCVVSVVIALAYVLGLISFPAFLAGMITTTGLGLIILSKHSNAKSANNNSLILYIIGVVVGLASYYGMLYLGPISNLFAK